VTLSLICIALLLAPGMVIRPVIRLQFGGFFSILLLSLAVFLIAVHLATWLSSFGYFYLTYGALVILGICNFVRHISRGTPLTLFESLSTVARKIRAAPEALVLVLFLLYYAIAGPYLEVPADLWNHLTSIRHYSTALDHGEIDTNQPWYLLLAFSAYLSGQTIAEELPTLHFFLQSIFLVGFASFVREVTRSRVTEPADVYLIVVCSTLLTVVTYGTSVFAFFSYYVFAPVFINIHLFLFAGLLIFHFRERGVNQFSFLLSYSLLALVIPISYLFHKQETLFIGVLIWGHGISTAITMIRNKSLGNRPRSVKDGAHCLFDLMSCALFVLVTLYGIHHILFTFDTSQPLYNNTLNIGHLLSRSSSILVADPLGRVLETVGILGIATVCLYFLFIPARSRPKSLSIMATAPYAILFIPVYSDTLLSVIPQDTLWRLSYITPFGLLASYTLYCLVRAPRVKLVRTIIAAGLVIVLLSPVDTFRQWPSSRYPTLPPVGEQLESTLWHDLFEELRRIGPRNVLTDPVTCYLVNALTSSRCFGFKFHGSGRFIPINYELYGEHHFSDFRKWLVIVNKRDGSISENGRRSGHWSPEIMIVSKSYSEKFDAFLETAPPHINLVWNTNQINIYEID